MTATSSTTTPEFFDRMYRTETDPWSFATDPYELSRYTAILEHVPPGRFGSVFEPGCSIGVLTEQLADRCNRVLAVDISVVAVERCRSRCAHLPNVDVAAADLEPPLGRGFDLVVLSEVGYYSTSDAFATVMERMSSAVRPGGRIIALHWTGHSDDHVVSGDEVHDTIATALGNWRQTVDGRVSHESRVGYRLGVWDRHAG
jgi:SAM-dependent methyltransferase